MILKISRICRKSKFYSIKVIVEGLYYPYSENKGADQLRGLCFRICKKPVFSRRGSNYIVGFALLLLKLYKAYFTALL